MELIDRYVYAVTKKLPKSQKENVTNEVRKLIQDKIQDKGGYTPEIEEQVLNELGHPEILVEKYIQFDSYLIGPKLYNKYIYVLKIVVPIIVFLGLLGNTIEFAVNNIKLTDYFLGLLTSIISGAFGSFGVVTLIFAIFEKNKDVNFLNEHKKDWSIKDLPHRKPVLKPFSIPGTIVEIIFTVIFMVILNNVFNIIQLYLTDQNKVYVFVNKEVFNSYLPYINILLSCHLIFLISKLIFRQWTFVNATANLIINILSLILILNILGDTSIINPIDISGVNNLSGESIDIGIKAAVVFLKIIFPFVLILNSAEGFYKAYKNRE